MSDTQSNGYLTQTLSQSHSPGVGSAGEVAAVMFGPPLCLYWRYWKPWFYFLHFLSSAPVPGAGLLSSSLSSESFPSLLSAGLLQNRAVGWQSIEHCGKRGLLFLEVRALLEFAFPRHSGCFISFSSLACSSAKRNLSWSHFPTCHVRLWIWGGGVLQLSLNVLLSTCIKRKWLLCEAFILPSLCDTYI